MIFSFPEIYKGTRDAEMYNIWVDERLMVMSWLFIVQDKTFIMLILFQSPHGSLTSAHFRNLSDILLSVSYMTIQTSLWEEMRRIG